MLLYLTGHGGDEFLKFHDQEELLAADLANALLQMHLAGRYAGMGGGIREGGEQGWFWRSWLLARD